MRRLALLGLLATPLHPLSAQQWSAMQSNTLAEFRGLHAVNPRIVWAAGQRGVVSHTRDGGRTWQVDSIPDARTLFLVAVRALDAKRAWVVGTAFQGASLARVFFTADGGKSWKLQYENATKGVFFDGLGLWDAHHAIAFSDPIDGRLLAITTKDGRTWEALSPDRLPAMLPGEAAFAASGTAITVRGKSEVWIATGGGAHARVLYSGDRGLRWAAYDTPARGAAAKGLFGIAVGQNGRAVAVGGDYQRRDSSEENLLLSDDGGRSWRLEASPGLAGVQYGVAFGGGSRFVAVGPGGSALSSDGGRSWVRLSGPGYNTVDCRGGTCWAAGVEGRIGKLPLTR